MVVHHYGDTRSIFLELALQWPKISFRCHQFEVLFFSRLVSMHSFLSSLPFPSFSLSLSAFVVSRSQFFRRNSRLVHPCRYLLLRAGDRSRSYRNSFRARRRRTPRRILCSGTAEVPLSRMRLFSRDR